MLADFELLVQFGYLEVNPLVTLPMSRRGVKMLIGTFMWFGTDAGDALRRYAIDREIPLAWAFNPTIAAECGVGLQPPPSEGCTDWGGDVPRPRDLVAIRLLDPGVLDQVPEGHNFTADIGTKQHFDSVWQSAASALGPTNSFAARLKSAKSLWSTLLLANPTGGSAAGVASIAVEPPFAGACASQDCIGVRVADQRCVCERETPDQMNQPGMAK